LLTPCFNGFTFRFMVQYLVKAVDSLFWTGSLTLPRLHQKQR
jgi:hypothetical protein